jgi:hypothetical protein
MAVLHPRWRITGILTVASGIASAFMLILLPVSYDTNIADVDSSTRRLTSPASIPILSCFRCGVYRGGIWFFTGDVPYMGSSTHAADESGILGEGGHAREIRDWCCGAGCYGFLQVTYVADNRVFVGRDRAADLPGVYYRYFEWWNSPRPWSTLRISLWLPILVFAVLPVSWFVRQLVRFSEKE